MSKADFAAYIAVSVVTTAAVILLLLVLLWRLNWVTFVPPQSDGKAVTLP